jgi:uncharacterized protein with GYD domain
MPHYCHQVSYTKEAWARLMADPQDRLEIVRLPIEKLGGKLHTAFFAFGPFDVLAITEMPDNISAAAIAIAFAAGGAVAHVQTTPLMTAAQTVEALKKAGTCGYKSIVSGHGAARAPERRRKAQSATNRSIRASGVSSALARGLVRRFYSRH